LKLIPMADAPPESAQAFVRAMGLLQAIRHPSLPTLFDFGFTPDAHAFLVLEYVEGRDALALQGGSPAQILPLLTQVLEGLERMSKEGLAHHNLCPENLLVVPGPAPGRIQMAGLGTAALRLPGQRPEREAAAYAAPEMSRPLELAVAPWRADLYSLARIACQLLEARLDAPRGGGDDPQAPEVTLPLGVCFELEDDRGLKEILERSLRSQPDERPTFGELRQAFGRALSGAAGTRALPESRIFVSELPEPEIEPNLEDTNRYGPTPWSCRRRPRPFRSPFRSPSRNPSRRYRKPSPQRHRSRSSRRPPGRLAPTSSGGPPPRRPWWSPWRRASSPCAPARRLRPPSRRLRRRPRGSPRRPSRLPPPRCPRSSPSAATPSPAARTKRHRRNR
jgi:serine/threonine protein kinase